MGVIDYFDTKRELEEIAMERGQYCYEYVMRLEPKLARYEKALRKIADRNRGMGSSCWYCDEMYGDGPGHLSGCGYDIAKKALEDK